MQAADLTWQYGVSAIHCMWQCWHLTKASSSGWSMVAAGNSQLLWTRKLVPARPRYKPSSGDDAVCKSIIDSMVTASTDALFPDSGSNVATGTAEP